MDRDQPRHASTGLVFAADEATGRLGGDHRYIDAGRRLDLAEMDVEPVGEHQRLALERRRDGAFVDRPLLLIRHEHHDDVARTRRIGDRPHLEAVRSRFLPRRTARPQPDDDARAAVAQVLRVRAALTAVSDDGEHAIVQTRAVAVSLVIHAHR